MGDQVKAAWLDKPVGSLHHVEICQSDEPGTWTAFNHLNRQAVQLGDLEYTILKVVGKSSGLSVRRVAEATLFKLDQRFDRFDQQAASQIEQVGEAVLRLGQIGLLRIRDAEQPVVGFRLAELLSPGRLLVLHVRGINPEKWLEKIAPYCGLLYSRSMVLAWSALACCLSLLLLLDFDRLLPQARELGWLGQPGDGLLLLAIFVFTVAAHELGHAIVSTRLGARCPDMGLILMFGTPCVYCDVSEAWKLPSWKQRASIAAAGIYTEMVIACLAALVWLCTTAGTANTVAFEIMMVSTVSTLLVNLNPLMRFDGYFILADLLREPNLRQKADTALRGIARVALGSKEGRDLGGLQPGYCYFLAAFALAGAIYRIGLSLAIAALSIFIADSWDLVWAGRFFALLLLWSWWAPALAKLLGGFAQLSFVGRAKLVVPAVVLIGIAFVPLPMRTFSNGWMEPQQSSGVFVESNGTLTNCLVRDGDAVRQGDLLFQIENVTLASELIAAELQVEKARSQRQFQRHARATRSDANVSGEVSTVEAIEGVYKSISQRCRQLDLIATNSGRFSALWDDPDRNSSRHLRAVRWTEAGHHGAFLEAGHQLGVIHSGPHSVVAVVNTVQLKSLEVGGTVALSVGSSAIAKAKISKIVAYDDFQSPWPFAMQRGRGANEDLFCVVIELPKPLATALPGASVDLVFHCQPRSVAAICFEYLLGMQASLLD